MVSFISINLSYSSDNQHYARLILGAYLGRPLLRYRRMYHVYMRVLKLAETKDKKQYSENENLPAMLDWLDTHGPKYKECIKEFKTGLRITRKKVLF